MVSGLIGPALAVCVLLLISAALGVYPVRRLVRLHEAKHELKHGSAGWLRSMSGWSVIAVWLLITWFLATIIGDWGASGDLEGAFDRSWLRLRILMDILIVILESDN